jgi:hypothetical protein
VPVLTGMVVARGNEDLMIEVWGEDRAGQIAKQEGKRKGLMLGLWKKVYSGLRLGREGGESIQRKSWAEKRRTASLRRPVSQTRWLEVSIPRP